MTDPLRRYFNALDRWLDRRSLAAEHAFAGDGGPERAPVTARGAFAKVWPVVRRLDRSARLKRIVGGEDLDAEGRSSRWEFFFDLPRRRAQAECVWYLPWCEGESDYGPARVEGQARPFPRPESIWWRNVREGKLFYRQLNGLWRQERQRVPDLPLTFRDSGEAMRELRVQGLDPTLEEVTLSTETVAGVPVWVAVTRHQRFQIGFGKA